MNEKKIRGYLRFLNPFRRVPDGGQCYISGDMTTPFDLVPQGLIVFGMIGQIGLEGDVFFEHLFEGKRRKNRDFYKTDIKKCTGRLV